MHQRTKRGIRTLQRLVTPSLLLLSLTLTASQLEAKPRFRGQLLAELEEPGAPEGMEVGLALALPSSSEGGAWLGLLELEAGLREWGEGSCSGTSEGVRADVYELCIERSLGALAAIERSWEPADRVAIGLQGGVGGWAARREIGGSPSWRVDPSGVLRVGLSLRLGEALTGQWWVGLQWQLRRVGLEDGQQRLGFGLVLEGRSLD